MEDTMNKDQKKKVELGVKDLTEAKGQIEQIEMSKIAGLLSDARTTLEGVRDEIQESYENMGEKVQEGEKGEAAQQAVENLEEAISAIEELEAEVEKGGQWAATIDEAVEKAESAAG
jgi:hypothetical protein